MSVAELESKRLLNHQVEIYCPSKLTPALPTRTAQLYFTKEGVGAELQNLGHSGEGRQETGVSFSELWESQILGIRYVWSGSTAPPTVVISRSLRR